MHYGYVQYMDITKYLVKWLQYIAPLIHGLLSGRVQCSQSKSLCSLWCCLSHRWCPPRVGHRAPSARRCQSRPPEHPQSQSSTSSLHLAPQAACSQEADTQAAEGRCCGQHFPGEEGGMKSMPPSCWQRTSTVFYCLWYDRWHSECVTDFKSKTLFWWNHVCDLFFYFNPPPSVHPAVEKCQRRLIEDSIFTNLMLHISLFILHPLLTPNLHTSVISLSLSPSRSLPLHLFLFFYSSFFHEQQSGQIAGKHPRADHLSSPEYWKLATGAMKHNKSFS